MFVHIRHTIRRAFEGTLRVVCGLTIFRNHRRNTVVEPPFSPRELPDDIVGDAGRECNVSTVKECTEDFEEDLQQIRDDQRSELEPDYFDGDASITIAKDEDGNRCFALLLTARIARDQNQVALAELKRKAKQNFVKKLEDSISELEAMSGKPSGAIGVASDLGPDEQTAQSHITSRLQKLKDHKYLLEKEIRAQDLSIAFGNSKIQGAIADAMHEAGLLKEPIYEEDESLLINDDPEYDKSQPQLKIEDVSEDIGEVQLSGPEKAIEDARRNFWEAEQLYFNQLKEFQSSEAHYEASLAAFKEASARGQTETTKSEFDVAHLRKQMQMTTQLIEAEDEYDRYREEAEQLGAFDDGWGQDSYYGDSEATVQSLGDGEAPKGGFKAILSEENVQEIETWLVDVNETESPDLIVQVDFDQWTSRAVDLSDSLSVVDWSSNGKRIAEWELKCDDHRDEWQSGEGRNPGQLAVTPGLQSRPRACSI